MSSTNSPKPKASYRSLFTGAGWMVLLRWSIRFIGLISTIILARLLTPEDFGLVAMATVVVGMLDILFESNAAQVLIRNSNVDQEQYDTGWTIILIQSIILAMLLVLTIPLATWYFRDERIAAILWVLAGSSVIHGIRNIGVINFRKNLDFRKDFQFNLYSRLITFVIVIIASYILRSYWALVIGMVASSFFQTVLSYVMHPYRPRLCLTHWREFLTYSLIITPANIAHYFANKMDVLVVGRIGSIAQMGSYNVSSELSRMITAEIVVPIGRALLPNYALLANDPAKIKEIFTRVTQAIAIICASMGVGLSAVAEDFVLVVLGDQWLSAADLVRWLALAAAINALTSSMTLHIFIAFKLEKVLLLLNCIRLALVTISVTIASIYWGVIEIAIAIVVAQFLYLPIVIYCLQRTLGINSTEILHALHRPIIAASCMALSIHFIQMLGIETTFIALLLNIFIGAIVFILTLLGIWILEGRPESAESMMINLIKQRITKLRQA